MRVWEPPRGGSVYPGAFMSRGLRVFTAQAPKLPLTRTRTRGQAST
ncbi:MAG: hypothetical protein BJ554DRAFT_4088, partial [Olpidium bornovanus]